MMGTVSVAGGSHPPRPKDMSLQRETPTAGPERPGATRRRTMPRIWDVPPRWPWIACPMLLVGAAIGVGLYFTTHGKAFTSTTSALTPPAAMRPFGWPLRLQRRVNVLVIGIDSTIDDQRRVCDRRASPHNPNRREPAGCAGALLRETGRSLVFPHRGCLGWDRDRR